MTDKTTEARGKTAYHVLREVKGGPDAVRTRTQGGGRGFTGLAAVYFDEAMIFPQASLGAILPLFRRGRGSP